MPYDGITAVAAGALLLTHLAGVIALCRTALHIRSYLTTHLTVSVAKTSSSHIGLTHQPGYAGVTLTALGLHLYLSWTTS